MVALPGRGNEKKSRVSNKFGVRNLCVLEMDKKMIEFF